MSHFEAIERIKSVILSSTRKTNALLKVFKMTTKTRGENLLFEWVAAAFDSPMTIKQATKHVKLADYYFKFGEMFPALPLLQPLGTHDR